MDQTQLARHILTCIKEVANIKASIDDGFKRIEGWIKTIVTFGVGTVTLGLGTVRFPVDCGFATCSANTSASIASLQSHGLRHRNKQGNEDLHWGSHHCIRTKNQGGDDCIRTKNQGGDGQLEGGDHCIRTKNQGGDGQLEACDGVGY